MVKVIHVKNNVLSLILSLPPVLHKVDAHERVFILLIERLETHPACDVVATSHFGLIQVGTSRTTLRRHHDVATDTLMSQTFLGTSHWHLNKTDQFETSQRRTNCYLNGTDKLETSQRRHNRYLNGTYQFETS